MDRVEAMIELGTRFTNAMLDITDNPNEFGATIATVVHFWCDRNGVDVTELLKALIKAEEKATLDR